MTNTNALEGIRCPKCGNQDKFRVAALTTATIIDNGVENTEATFWEGDAETACADCGFTSEWANFAAAKNLRPYSTCVTCRQTIWYDQEAGFWYPNEAGSAGEEGPECYNPDRPEDRSIVHQPRWLTLGEFRDRTKNLPDATPLTAYGGNIEGVSEWVNLQITREAVDNFLNDMGSSLILDITDDFDTRQW